MTHEEVREATKEAIRVAEESGAVISFDPNFTSTTLEFFGCGKETGIIWISTLSYPENLRQ